MPTEAGVIAALACAQCGRPLPDAAARDAGWRPGELLASGGLDEGTAPMLLCPDCAAADALGEFDPGEVD